MMEAQEPSVGSVPPEAPAAEKPTAEAPAPAERLSVEGLSADVPRFAAFAEETPLESPTLETLGA
jgi:hypothetical protein